MQFIRAVTLAAVAACALVGGSAGAADKSPFEGAWKLTMQRPKWDPPVVSGRLVLEKPGGKWGGSVTFERVLNGTTNRLLDVVVKGSTAEFRVDALSQDIRFDAKLDKSDLAGRCNWKGCGTFEWTAVRADEKPIERFEKGLSFDGYLPKGDAEKLGMNGDALDTLIRDASGNDTDAVIVLRDGQVVAERYFGRPQTPIHVMSITKWVTAFAVAMLLDDKKIASLEAPVSSWFPDCKNGRKGKVTLRHLVTHTSGIEHEKTAEKLNAAKDKVAYVRARDVVAEPGAEWSYNNDAVALLSGVLGAAAGRPVDDYLKDRLFEPLDVKRPEWDRDAAGATITYAQLALCARDLARVGQLVVDGGKVGKKQVLAPESIALLGSQATPVKDDQGVLWMLLRDGAGKDVVGCFHTGSLGQWIVVETRTKTVGVRLRRGTGGDKPEFEFGAFASRLAAAAK